MYGWKEKLYRFFYGRYGFDNLGKALMLLYVIIAILNVIIGTVTSRYILYTLQWVLLIFILFRMFSRNIAARRKENTFYEKHFGNSVNMIFTRIKDIRYKRYRRCPNCKAYARLPIKRGKHSVRCPACHTEFKVFIAL